mgnify:CR=1 FL=1
MMSPSELWTLITESTVGCLAVLLLVSFVFHMLTISSATRAHREFIKNLQSSVENLEKKVTSLSSDMNFLALKSRSDIQKEVQEMMENHQTWVELREAMERLLKIASVSAPVGIQNAKNSDEYKRIMRDIDNYKVKI